MPEEEITFAYGKHFWYEKAKATSPQMSWRKK